MEENKRGNQCIPVSYSCVNQRQRRAVFLTLLFAHTIKYNTIEDDYCGHWSPTLCSPRSDRTRKFLHLSAIDLERVPALTCLSLTDPSVPPAKMSCLPDFALSRSFFSITMRQCLVQGILFLARLSLLRSSNHSLLSRHSGFEQYRIMCFTPVSNCSHPLVISSLPKSWFKQLENERLDFF